ncbi:MAG: hypothetical protein AAF487_13055 [Bacteroidota bacterium]
MFSSCALFDDVAYEVTPDPLEAHGDMVTLSAKATVPEKKMHKNAVVEITPVLRKEDGSEVSFKTITVQGEKAAGNGIVINSKTGGSFDYSDQIDYTPDMMKSEVYLKVKAGKGVADKELDEVKIADGVVATPYLVVSDEQPIASSDKFQRITQHDTKAEINFLVNQSSVRRSEMKQDDIKELEQFFTDVVTNPRWDIKSIDNPAFASPEGKIDRNDALANKRAESGVKTLNNLMKKAGLEAQEGMWNSMGKGEDWDGFKEAMLASNIDDKDLIIRILEQEKDLDQREKEIRNMSVTYREINKDVFPQLRRTSPVVNYEITGFSDEELLKLGTTQPDSLKLEEILKAATLTEDLDQKLAMYTAARNAYPEDYRTWNNEGYVKMLKNDMSGAKSAFEKANELSQSAEGTNNLATQVRLGGDREKAYKMYKDAVSAGSTVNQNMAIIDIQNGNYSDAVRNLQNVNSCNAALARILNGDASGASTILDNAPDGDSGTGHYLRAIIAARTGNSAAIAGHLSKAIAADPSLKDRAMKDAEFLKFQDVLGL